MIACMSDSPSASGPDDTPPAPVRYVPADIEQRWMQRWMDADVFAATFSADREPYSIVIPPPNVTGALHMGHALNGSIQDALVRFERMRGKDVMWIPGTDHAGIATQAVVERTLKADGISRHDLGRERFVDKVWDWKAEYGATIIKQFTRLGCSLDYERERFTMDEGYAAAVLEAFTRLYDKGYIYRDNYLINWDAGSMSAISDLEVKQVELVDEMVSIAYELVDGSGEIVVATVRPETVVADVAVAVHPDDPRYTHLVGKEVRVPLTDRTVPIIADEHVKIDFGTGALKITPGHDPNDFEIGNRHGLPQLTCIHFNRTMTDLAGEFAGMSADDARPAMIDKLDSLGLVRDREPYKHMVPHSDRSGVRIEPLISLQWFCDMTELAKPAVALVDSGEVRFVPDGARNIFMSWMTDIKPWCLSRQLWWGHQLPVWYCSGIDEHVHVSADGPGDVACPECGAEGWTRDPDVLDTWFSSGLWDFATMGWPDQTRELEYYHPTSVLCTAREIINLWVARMMMLSLEFLGEKPFSDVYIHSVIQASDGRRMSKSLGNGADPLELIEKFGADATRYGLLNMSSTQDVRFNEGKIAEGRDLANKLWNASRLLVLMGESEALREQPAVDNLTHLEDRWIFSRLHRTIVALTSAMEQYEFANYTKELYSFVFSELCDWYLESVKSRLRSDDHDTRRQATAMLATVLDQTLRLVHPVMPHLTEEIAEQVWGESDKFVATSEWPTSPHELFQDASWGTAEDQYAAVQALTTRLRSLRQAAGVAPSQATDVVLSDADGSMAYLADASNLRVIETLAGVRFAGGDGDGSGEADPAGGITIPIGARAALTLRGLDAATLRPRLEAERKNALAEVTRAEGKLANEKFTARAPEDLVDAERVKITQFTLVAGQLDEVLGQL